jgi:hypothetical protein
MTTALPAASIRRRTAFVLPESLIARLDQMAVTTGQSRSHVLEALLAGELAQAERDPDALLYDSRKDEPDLSLNQCPELLARIERLLAE